MGEVGAPPPKEFLASPDLLQGFCYNLKRGATYPFFPNLLGSPTTLQGTPAGALNSRRTINPRGTLRNSVWERPPPSGTLFGCVRAISVTPALQKGRKARNTKPPDVRPILARHTFPAVDDNPPPPCTDPTCRTPCDSCRRTRRLPRTGRSPPASPPCRPCYGVGYRLGVEINKWRGPEEDGQRHTRGRAREFLKHLPMGKKSPCFAPAGARSWSALCRHVLNAFGELPRFSDASRSLP